MSESPPVPSGSPRMPAPVGARALAVVGGANVFIAILLVIQMWLLTASLESFLADHDEAALPGAVVSGLLFIGCLLLARFIDSASRRGSAQ